MESDISAIWTGALLVVYLGATSLPLVAHAIGGARAGTALHLVALGIAAGATWLPAIPSWLRRWAPLGFLLFLYAELPLLIQSLGHRGTLDDVVIGWEGALFGAQPALVWSAHWPSRVLSEVLHSAYLSYYAIIFVVPALLFLRGRMRDFDEAVFVLMLTFIACFTWYLVFPVAGPRYVWPERAQANGGMVRGLVLRILEAGSSRGTAFPSSHVAVAVTQAALAVRYFGARGLPLSALTAALAAGAVYGGFHYAIDVIAGAALAAVVCPLGLGACRRLRARYVVA